MSRARTQYVTERVSACLALQRSDEVRDGTAPSNQSETAVVPLRDRCRWPDRWRRPPPRAPAPRDARLVDGEHDLAGGVALREIANGIGGCAQRIGLVQNGFEPSGSDQVVQGEQILLALFGDQAHDLLRSERRENGGQHLPLKAAEPAKIGRASCRERV